MDPTNNPTPNPTPSPAPEPLVAPEAPAVPGAPVAPEAPAAPAAPTPATAAGGITTPPVNPIINPGGAAGGPAGNPVGNPAAQTDGILATDPIMMPEPAPAPDPVEEELKAPMKAAAPAPGSIGSAVSGPMPADAGAPAPNGDPFAANKQTPSVAFNDPATQPDAAAAGTGGMAPAKKQTNKTTLIALIIVAAMIVIALVGILIFQLMGDQGTGGSGSTTPNNPVTIEEEDNEGDDTGTDNSGTLGNGTLSCTRNMTDAEVAKYNDAVSGTINVSAEFDADELLTSISLIESVIYSDEDAVNNEPVQVEMHESTADELTTASALNFYLPVDDLGELDLTEEGIQTNYESLDFVCEVL